ncbi:AsmA-like C-terminal region-containing protein [Terrarubrum flagellatum]|uniref:AsmA-like C-terminal region-containing protein n=1 Tax=Terrirubrum flagellatum TaxID=2895980 RepID=UPI003144EE55
MLCLKGCVIGAIVAVAAAYGLWRFAAGRLPVEWVRDRLVGVIEQATGGRANVALRSASVRQTDDGPKLVLDGFALRDVGGKTVVGAPRAEIGFDLWTLIFGGAAMRQIELHDVEVRLVLDRGGQIVFSAVQPTGEQTSGASDWRGVVASVAAALSGKDLGLGGLSRIALRNGKLTVDDPSRGVQLRYENIAIDLDPADVGRRLSVRAQGPSGEVSLVASRDARAADRMQFDFSGLSLADAGQMLRLPVKAIDGGAALAGHISILLDEAGEPQAVAADVKSQAGKLAILPGAPEETVLSGLELRSAWDAESRTTTIERAAIATDAMNAEIAGQIISHANAAWEVEIASGKGQVRSVRAGAQPIAINRIEGRAAWIGDGVINIPSWIVSGAGYEFRGDGKYTPDASGGVWTTSLSASQMDAVIALSFWPSFAAWEARAYMLQHLEKGQLDRLVLRLRMDAAYWAAMRKQGQMPRDGIDLDIAMSKVRYAPLPEFPSLDIDIAQSRIDGRDVTVTAPTIVVETPAKTRVVATEAKFTSDYTNGPGPSRVEFRVKGPADAAFDLTETPLIKRVTDVGDSLDVVKGTADIRTVLSFPINTPLKIEDVVVAMGGTINGATIEGAIPNDPLTDVRAFLTFERGELALKGEGRVSGAPAVIDVKRSSAGVGDASLTVTTDDASRQKRGLPSTPGLAGPVPVKMMRSLGGQNNAARVEIDLTRATVNNLVPGWTKAPGRPGKISFSYAPSLKNTDVELQDFSAESQGFQLKGVVTLAANNSVKLAKFAQARLSPGDEARIEWERVGTTGKLTIRGANIDARPLVKGIYDPQREAPAESLDIEVDLKSAIVTGFNGEAVTNVEMRTAKRGGELKQFQLTGRFGKADIRGTLARRGDGQARLLIETADAGAFMRFNDLYRRMIGGRLNIDIAANEGRQDGELVVKDFILRNEPALRQAAGQQPATTADNGGLNRAAVAAARGEVEFEKVRVNFVRNAGRIDVRDGVMWGPVLGVEFEGIVDAPRDRIDVTGTYVPAYALNNAFAQVPVVGMILGGGQYGGLFGVNFKVSGTFSQPSVAVNPLSALTPGVFRRFLEFSKQSEEGQAGRIPPAPVQSNQ